MTSIASWIMISRSEAITPLRTMRWSSHSLTWVPHCECADQVGEQGMDYVAATRLLRYRARWVCAARGCAAVVLLRRHDVPLWTQILCASFHEASHQVPLRFRLMMEPPTMIVLAEISHGNPAEEEFSTTVHRLVKELNKYLWFLNPKFDLFYWIPKDNPLKCKIFTNFEVIFRDFDS